MRVKKLAKLKFNLWFYFLLFSIVIILFIWIFQILLFDSVYRRQKFENLIETGGNLSEALNIDLDQEINGVILNNWLKLAVDASEAGVLACLCSKEERNGVNEIVIETIYSGYAGDTSSDADSVTTNRLEGIIGVDGKTVAKYALSRLDASGEAYICDIYEDKNNSQFCYFYITKVSNAKLNDGYLLLLSSQKLLTEMVKVIQIQLGIITICVVILSFFFSMIISTKLSKPIVEMSRAAKKWANGDESVVFKATSYDELAELAETLNYAKDGIAQAGLLQRDLLANVSHDLKTPLTMIKAYAEMIRDLSGNVKEKRDLHTKVIIDEADRLAMLVNDILDLSKLQNGMDTLDVKIVNLSELCESVIYRFKEFAERSGYTIVSEIEADLFTECDEQKIEQVIYNLIGNSLNYTGEDKTVVIRLAKRDENIILFETIDSGKGISEENVNVIWEKYYRFSETHQRPIKGTGLGLSIVRTILQAHNLKFGVKSTKGLGSNFFIAFKGVANE